MPAPAPPVALKNQCSVIYNNTLYVYTPDAFLSLPLRKGGNWTIEQNGVSVVGAKCVKGGTDGDNSKAALYVVGGTANSTSSSYSGLQRFSFQEKKWQTINPVVPVTQHRVNHGAAYLNSSSCIVLYAGSQNGQTGASSETFLIQMYPPYRVQAYSATAPPASNPQMLPWSSERALMVGGSTPNDKVFTFGAADGWKDVNITLPSPLPDPSIAQSGLIMFDDGSKVLQTYRMDQTPPLVTSYVLLNPGGLPASNGQMVGGNPAAVNTTNRITSPNNATIPTNNLTSSIQTPTTLTDVPSTSTDLVATSTDTAVVAPKVKRQQFLQIYPQYSAANAPNTTRTGFTIAQDSSGLVAMVGGNDEEPVVFFNQFRDGWVPVTDVLGTPTQRPLTSSTSTTSTTSSTISTASTTVRPTTAAPTATTTPAADSTNSNRGLIMLGAVLGAICVLAAILIILLLWLRSIKKKRAREQQKGAKRRSNYPTDKHSFEEQGMQPLSKAGQPMGMVSVPIAPLVREEDYRATGAKSPEKAHIRKVSGESTNRAMSPSNAGGLSASGGFGLGQGLFKREKSPLVISKPMQPNLGDYQERPAIELGKATPTLPALAVAPTPNRQPSNRKTDEGWGKYFQAENLEEKQSLNRVSTSSASPTAPPHGKLSPTAAPSPAARGTSSFWPNSITPQASAKPQKMALRDSVGNALNTQTVAAGSPSLERGPSGRASRNMAAASGTAARISTASSVNTTDTGYSEGDYEDDNIEPAYASGASLGPGQVWTPPGPVAPVAQNWGVPPPPRPVRRQSMIGPGPTLSTLSEEEHSPGDMRTSIPTFPMPTSTIRPVQPSGGSDMDRYGPGPTQPNTHWIIASRKFSEAPARHESSARHSRDESATNSDVSWLQLRDKKA